MVITITKSQLLEKKDYYSNEIRQGKLFVYPTDTVYGLGCNALDSSAVAKLRTLKGSDKPFSVIVPGKAWIKKNMVIPKKSSAWLDKLPGPYTLILRKKVKACVAGSVSNAETLGVRIPANWFARIIEELNLPFVTTSANLTGEAVIVSTNMLPEELKTTVDYIIDEGEIRGTPSTLVHLVDNEEKVVYRK